MLFATIGINVFFIVETTKKLSLQTTADYPSGGDNAGNELATGIRDQTNDQKGRPMRDYNHFYNNDLIPPTVNSGGFDTIKLDSGNNVLNPKHMVDENQFMVEGNGGNTDQQQQQLNMNAPQRSNQLKLQELSKPKSISIEVLSSKSKVSVNIDGTTVSDMRTIM